MAYCEACEALMKYAPNFVVSGITDKECKSLGENKGLNPDLPVLHKNCEDIGDIIDCLIAKQGDMLKAFDICEIKDYLKDHNDNLYQVLKALKCSDCGQWSEIEDIRTSISGQYKRLVRGRDYDLTFYNGFYTEADDFYVGIIETADKILLKMTNENTNAWALENERLINVDMAHSSPIGSVPRARVYGIVFKGEYARFNNYSVVNGIAGSTGIWNIKPESLRASWDAQLWPYPDTQGQKVIIGLASYADGYNTQFTVYGNNNIYTTHINHVVDLTLIKP